MEESKKGRLDHEAVLNRLLAHKHTVGYMDKEYLTNRHETWFLVSALASLTLLDKMDRLIEKLDGLSGGQGKKESTVRKRRGADKGG